VIYDSPYAHDRLGIPVEETPDDHTLTRLEADLFLGLMLKNRKEVFYHSVCCICEDDSKKKFQQT
jgi:hypothetical protein